jgi:hypothetical protein
VGLELSSDQSDPVIVRWEMQDRCPLILYMYNRAATHFTSFTFILAVALYS